MKKNIINIIGIITIILITFYACKKDIDKINNNDNQTEITNLDDYLIEFKEKIKSSERSNDYISIEDAEWHLTALQNFELCDASNFCPNIIIDTFYTNLRVKNDSVSLFELNDVYESNISKIVDKYRELDGDFKNIYYINSKIESNYRSDFAKVTTITNMINDNSNIITSPNVFDSTDYWYDFEGKGKCGEYAGECIGQDATTQMNMKLQYYIPTYNCVNGRVYFTDISSHLYVGARNPYCEDSPTPPYCLHVGTSQYEMCMSPDDLNWYLNKSLEIIDEIEELYYGSSLFYIELLEDACLGSDDGNRDRYQKTWTLDLTFGKINCTSIKPNM